MKAAVKSATHECQLARMQSSKLKKGDSDDSNTACRGVAHTGSKKRVEGSITARRAATAISSCAHYMLSWPL